MVGKVSAMIAADDPLAQGRARVERRPSALVIVIPARRDWPLLLFLLVWLGAWITGGVNVISGLMSGDRDDGSTAFLLCWLGGWVLGVLFAVSVVWWTLFGRETISCDQTSLTVTRAAWPFRRSKRFRRDGIERIRGDAFAGVLKNMFSWPRDAWRHGLEMWGLGGGSIVFDYGARTHRFGNKLDEAETRQLVELLRRELGARS